MDALYTFFGGIDTRIVIAVSAAVIIGILFLLMKKAFKAALLIFAIGFLFAVGKPIVLNELQSQGVTIDGTMVTVTETDGSTQSFDAGLITAFETEDSGDGANTIIRITFADGSQKTYEAPTTAVDGVETAIRIVSGIASSGYNVGASVNSGSEN